MQITIHPMIETDWPVVAQIYQQGIDTGNATFATCPPGSWQEWCQGKINECSLVAKDGDSIQGWAALSPVSNRYVYKGVAEVSLYVAASERGKGVGQALMIALIATSEANGFWTLQTGIFPENSGSLRLHLNNGFILLGFRERLGLMTFGPFEGKWRDVAFLERRSKTVGS
jgi:L-amino acid N-acyltransferase YncA